MPRELVDIDRNILKIIDSISQERIELYYRMPTNKERIDFQRECLVKVDAENGGSRVIFWPHAARQKYGAMILTGVSENAFKVKGQPVSTDPDSEHYFPQWKEHLPKAVPEWIALLARMVFEGVQVEEEVDLNTVETDGLPTGDEPPEAVAKQGETKDEGSGGEAAEVPLSSS